MILNNNFFFSIIDYHLFLIISILFTLRCNILNNLWFFLNIKHEAFLFIFPDL